MIGTVHWFASKGQSYGFIKYELDGGQRQVYVHYKSIGTKNLRPENRREGKWFREIRQGDIVEFELSSGFGVDGTQAVKVEIVTHA
jgi:cold shock CspA family protein